MKKHQVKGTVGLEGDQGNHRFFIHEKTSG